MATAGGTEGLRCLHGMADPDPAVMDERETRLARLMAAAQSGDASAYQALLRDCIPVIAQAARRQGVSPDRVDDVVQEVLITIHRARATYDPARPFLPWLRAIAQRRAIDSLRHHGRHAVHEVHDPIAYEAHAEEAADADGVLDAQARSRDLRASLETLPPGQRQAVDRLALRGQSLDEASAETGRSKVALKVNLHRAIKTLRGKLGVATDGGVDDV